MHRAVLFAIQENGRMLRTAGILQMKKGIQPRFQEYVKWDKATDLLAYQWNRGG
ncbi:hypothetical protein [Bacillus sp. 7894-2]|uniref:hypothetical protein n=1 Tax=Bacillus sp. 7894-2 TaxID=2021695 RepID=UPI0015C8A5F4|nr:hypothetical protein [Bacillus sp. 7894-2]